MSESIILAHADSDFAQSVQTALESEGYSVISYVTGQSALDATAAALPDLLIFGAVPDMDGLSALRHLRTTENTHDQRLLWIMPTESDEAIQQAWDEGADGVLNPSPSSEQIVWMTNGLLTGDFGAAGKIDLEENAVKVPRMA